MSYCSQCGAEVNGPFCAQCGAAQNPDAAEPLRASASNPFEAGSQEPAHPFAGESALRSPSDPSAPDIPGFFGAFAACFYKYAEPHGRASRSEFWYFALWFFLALILPAIADALFMPEDMHNSVDPEASRRAHFLCDAIELISGLLIMTMVVPLCFAACRRLHDSNKSGWFLGGGLLIGVPVVATAVTLFETLSNETISDLLVISPYTYYLSFLALLSIRLASRPTPGPNKYGPEPKKRR